MRTSRFWATPLIIIFLAATCFAQQENRRNPSFQPKAMNVYPKAKVNEVEQAASVDLVVLGRVTKIVPLPGPESEMFHSKVIVQIDSVIKGKAHFGSVVLKEQSGPLTNAGKSVSIHSSIEPSFSVGQQVILFLKHQTHSSYLQSPFVRERFKTFAGRPYGTAFPDSVFWVDNKSKFDVKNGTVFYFGEPRNEANFISNISRLK